MSDALPRVTFVTGPERSGKTTMAKSLMHECSPRSRTIWFDECDAARNMGARCLDEAEQALIGKGYDHVIVSAGDSSALAIILAILDEAWVFVVRCEAPVRA